MTPLPSPCLPPAGLAFSQKFPEAPEVLFFSKPEFLVHVSPVFGRIMVQPVRRYPERVGHDYREYSSTDFWSLWSGAGYYFFSFTPHTPVFITRNTVVGSGNKMAKIHVLDNEISLRTINNEDYICITDIARYKDPERTDYLIQNWLRNRNTIEFLGIWERLNNPDFNPIEFDGFRKQAGLHSFTLTARQWIEKTAAIGIISKPGRYGGTYAHKDIAYEFASWISVEFKLYLIKEFQRLKDNERKQLGWDIRRNLAKINYRIHTDAVKENLIPAIITPQQVTQVYASEADVLNMALFGTTAKEWREANPDKTGNIRDYADISQLVCLSNLENLNALFIGENLPQADRLVKLNTIAIHQMRLLTDDSAIRKIGSGDLKDKKSVDK